MNYEKFLGFVLPQKMKPSQVKNIVNTEKGQPNGLASLNSSGKVPNDQLPSYVDDVEEYLEYNDFPLVGEDGKIYVDKTTSKTYRWSGSGYINIGEPLVWDSTPTSGSSNPVTSNGIYSALDGKQNKLPNSSTVSGTYMLVNNVSTSGDSSYTWVAFTDADTTRY